MKKKPLFLLPAWLKSVLNYVPLILFFAAFHLYTLAAAIIALLISTVIASILLFISERKLALWPMITLVTVLIFGGASLIFQDDRFIKIKPTVVQLAFTLILGISAYIKKPVVKHLLSEAIDLSDEDWQRFSMRFAGLFLLGAVLNEWVWRTQSTEFWVSFKVFGLSGLSVVFFLSQIPFFMKRARNLQPERKKP